MNANNVCCRSNTRDGGPTTGASLLCPWTALCCRLQSGMPEQTLRSGAKRENKEHCLSPSIEITAFTSQKPEYKVQNRFESQSLNFIEKVSLSLGGEVSCFNRETSLETRDFTAGIGIETGYKIICSKNKRKILLP